MHPNTSTINDFIGYIKFLEQTYNAPFNGIITDINQQPFESAQQKGVNLGIKDSHRTQGGSVISGVQCDLTTSPFKSGVFPIVIADYTLGCIQKDKTQLFANEIQRLLTPNGLAFIAFREKIFPSLRRQYVRSLPSRFVYDTFQRCRMKLILNCESNILHDDLMVFGHNESKYTPYQPPIYDKSILKETNFE